jgi:hypothetical protein
MLILLDHSTPAPLRCALKDHVVVEAVGRGWERLANGALLDAAEEAGFELLVTADKNIRYQQNLTGRKISIVVLGNAQWPVLRRFVERVVAAVGGPRQTATPVPVPSRGPRVENASAQRRHELY